MAKKVLDHVVVTYYVSGRPQDPPSVHTYGPYTKSQARRVKRSMDDEFEEIKANGDVGKDSTLDTYPRKIVTIATDYRYGTVVTPAYQKTGDTNA